MGCIEMILFISFTFIFLPPLALQLIDHLTVCTWCPIFISIGFYTQILLALGKTSLKPSSDTLYSIWHMISILMKMSGQIFIEKSTHSVGLVCMVSFLYLLSKKLLISIGD